MSTESEALLREQNRLLEESNEIAREALERSKPRKPWVCGAWPYCFHGAIVGGIFGCY